jgi:hypothetical protein
MKKPLALLRQIILFVYLLHAMQNMARDSSFPFPFLLFIIMS